MSFPRLTIMLLLPLGAITLAACGGGGENGITDHAAAQSLPVEQAAPAAGQPSGNDSAETTVTPGLPGNGVDGDAERGREVFFANGCTVCHGDQGEGGIGPTLPQSRLDPEQLVAQARRPRGVMPRYDVSVIPDEHLADVLAWLHTLPLPERIVAGEGTP